jgi:hypothetical protein
MFVWARSAGWGSGAGSGAGAGSFHLTYRAREAEIFDCSGGVGWFQVVFARTKADKSGMALRKWG